MDHKTTKKLDAGVKLWRNGHQEAAEVALLKAFEMAPDDRELMIVVVQYLQEMGSRVAAIEVLQAYLSNNAADPTTVEICSQLAVQFEFYEIGEKLALISIQLEPAEPRHYVNYCNALRAQGKLCEAIELAVAALEKFPAYASLWSVLARCYVEKDGPNRHTRELMKHAANLDAANAQNLLSLANNSTDYVEAVELYEKTIELAPDSPEAHLSYAIYLLAQGKLNEAWPHYEYRLRPELGTEKSVQYECTAPIWNGESLKGKKILIGAEQGIGDELLFAVNYKTLMAQDAHIYIGCDPRLVDIYERSFEGAVCGAFKDTIFDGVRSRSFPAIASETFDYFIPAASLLQHLWRDLSTLPNFSEGYLRADPVQIEELKGRLPISSKPIIGLSWRSGNISEGRSHGYFGLDGAKMLVSNVDAVFVNLQYDVVDAEIEALKAVARGQFVCFEDIDLKQDIEANLALMSSLDYVVGPATATQVMAMAIGARTGLVSHGLPWWGFGETERLGPRFANNLEWFLRTVENSWEKSLFMLICRLHETFQGDAALPVVEMIRYAEYLVNIAEDHAGLFPAMDRTEYADDVRNFVLTKLYQCGAISAMDAELVTISDLRKFGSAFILTGIGRNFLTDEMGNEPISFDKRRNIAKMLEVACDKDIGGVNVSQKAILMTFVYAAFGYASFSVVMGRAGSTTIHSVNVVRDTHDKWIIQDGLLDCFVTANDGKNLDFFELVELLTVSGNSSENLFQTIYDEPLQNGEQVHRRISECRGYFAEDRDGAIEAECELFDLPIRWESMFLFPRAVYGHVGARDFAIKYIKLILDNNKQHLMKEWQNNRLK